MMGRIDNPTDVVSDRAANAAFALFVEFAKKALNNPHHQRASAPNTRCEKHKPQIHERGA
jgi:hypothetical protein